jgi:hypothetical protein
MKTKRPLMGAIAILLLAGTALTGCGKGETAQSNSDGKLEKSRMKGLAYYSSGARSFYSGRLPFKTCPSSCVRGESPCRQAGDVFI